MRIISFSKKWDKLANYSFTTFRFQRKDKDWQLHEQVKIVINTRSPKRKYLGVAEIVSKEPRIITPEIYTGGVQQVSHEEARADGFKDRDDMFEWLHKTYGTLRELQSMNKLTLEWRGMRVL